MVATEGSKPEHKTDLAAVVEQLPEDVELLHTGILHKLAIAGFLSLLVMVGLFLTNYSHDKARFYWTAMFPAFGLAGIWHALRAPALAPSERFKMVLREAFHWLGAMVAVRIVFLQLAWGQMDADAAALMTVLILAVTCYLAGVHFDSSFLWVSVLLAIASIVGTDVEGYLWLIVAVAIAAAVVALVALVMLRRRHARAAPA